MNNPELWLHGIEKCRQFYDALPTPVKPECNRLLEEIMRCKSELMALVSATGSSERCGQCGGKCCLYGKYHVTLIEVLAYLHTGTTILAPNFSNHPYCPYSNSSGCLMDEKMRPTTCVIFNCEKLENAFDADIKTALERLETELRHAISRFNAVIGAKMDRPMLLWSTESYETDHTKTD